MEMGERIKELRERRNMTQDELGDVLGVGKSTIARYESGRVENIKRKTIKDMAELFGVRPSYLMDMEDAPHGQHTRTIPILGVICAGNGVCTDQGTGAVPLIVDDRITADCCLVVHGDSMVDSGIYDGDIAFINESFEFDDGNIYAVVVGVQSEASIKTVFREDDKLVLYPSNRSYRPQRVDKSDVTIVGRLCGVYHKVEPK